MIQNLTVFSKKKPDIEGFNFAFIDDHLDYHTHKTRTERLDKINAGTPKAVI